MRNISAWSIRNPVVPIVLFVGLIIAGIVAFSGMKVQNDPDIEFPIVIVNIAQPGPSNINDRLFLGAFMRQDTWSPPRWQEANRCQLDEI